MKFETTKEILNAIETAVFTGNMTFYFHLLDNYRTMCEADRYVAHVYLDGIKLLRRKIKVGTAVVGHMFENEHVLNVLCERFTPGNDLTYVSDKGAKTVYQNAFYCNSELHTWNAIQIKKPQDTCITSSDGDGASISPITNPKSGPSCL